MPGLILGLDIGGTKIAGGLLTSEGKLVARQELPTEQDKGFGHSRGQMDRVIERLLAHARGAGTGIIGIGACAPGPLDVRKGILYNPPNLQGWENLPLRDLLQDRYGIPVYLDNDANAAGLAEAIWGAGKGHAYVFYATVSTGIGTGIILNRRIYHGKNGMAGEGGHVTIQFQDSARRCNCGNTGCIEAYASGTSVAKWARERLQATGQEPPLLRDETRGRWDKLTTKHIAKAARRGDPFSQAVISEAGMYLGIWLGSVVSLLDPDIIVIGGGLAQIGEPLFQAIRREMPSRTINRFARNTPVVGAHLGKDVGIFGGAALVLSSADSLT